ncbi:MAG: hypothetical protein ACXWDI_04440 [Nocardioides sp.]
MGTTGAHGVEVANSYARRSGSDVRLQIHLPQTEALESPTLQLKSVGKGPKRNLDTEVSVTPAAQGVLVTATVPVSEVEPGLWQVRVREGDADFRRVRARLLVDPKQPIALLSGPVPETRMAPPRPRKRRRQGPAQVAPIGYKAKLRGIARRVRPSR